MSSDNASVEGLEKLLETFVENTRQLGITVNDFQPASQAVLNQKINFLVTGLQDIDRAKGSVTKVVIPTEVFAYIDHGSNPALYTKDCLERTLQRNELVKGKVEVYSQFREELTSRLGEIYPELIEQYKQTREQ